MRKDAEEKRKQRAGTTGIELDSGRAEERFSHANTACARNPAAIRMPRLSGLAVRAHLIAVDEKRIDEKIG